MTSDLKLNIKIIGKGKMALPKIIKDRMDLKISEQLSITLFPDLSEGQPKPDIIKIKFKEIEGKETSLYFTPCEAMELASAISTAVQFYLYNQEQYREEILKPREKLAKQRAKKASSIRGL